jgi:hypothetical protein
MCGIILQAAQFVHVIRNSYLNTLIIEFSFSLLLSQTLIGVIMQIAF